jgi:MFS family permease
MSQQRWRRIIPATLVMYTIAYVDRTNVSLALDPSISSMMKDLGMDDRLKGQAAGIFFLGYMLLQIPSGYWAARWSARKLISLCLLAWGVCAIGCGLAQTFRQFEFMRFLLGVAESGVFPATLVLLANWFPRAERARANAYWTLCQLVAIAGTAPLTGWLIGAYGWRTMLILEGTLPFLLLPLWWFGVRDHPSQAAWLDPAERNYLEAQLRAEAKQLTNSPEQPGGHRLSPPMGGVVSAIVVLIAMYFLQNCQAYGCMTFFTTMLKGRGLSAVQYGILFAVPYAFAALPMLLNSAHSDRTQERRGHVALVYLLSGVSLILAVWLRGNFWLSYFFLSLAIPGPFAAMGPFWAIPGEMLPGARMGIAIGLVNAFGNLGGFVGPSIVGYLKQEYQSLAVPFTVLGLGMILAAALAFLLPRRFSPSPSPSIRSSESLS